MDAGVAVIPTAPERVRNRDTHFPYRFDSHFYYLTGFGEPEAVAVLIPGRSQAEYVLFVRDRDPTRETWDGRRAGPEGRRDPVDYPDRAGGAGDALLHRSWR